MRQMRRRLVKKELSVGFVSCPPPRAKNNACWISEDATACLKELDFDRKRATLTGVVMPPCIADWPTFNTKFGVSRIVAELKDQVSRGQQLSLLPLLDGHELAEYVNLFLALFPNSVEPLAIMATDNSYNASCISKNWSTLRRTLLSKGVLCHGFVTDLDGKMRRAGLHLVSPFFIQAEKDVAIGFSSSWCRLFLRAPQPESCQDRRFTFPYMWVYDFDHASRVAHRSLTTPDAPMRFDSDTQISLYILGELLGDDGVCFKWLNFADLNTLDSEQFNQRSDSAFRVFSTETVVAMRKHIDQSVEPSCRKQWECTMLLVSAITSLLRPFLYQGPVDLRYSCMLVGYGIYVFRAWRLAAERAQFCRESELGLELRAAMESLFHTVVLSLLQHAISVAADLCDADHLERLVFGQISQIAIECLWSGARGYGMRSDPRIDYGPQSFSQIIRYLLQLADYRRRPEEYGLNAFQWAKKKATHLRVPACRKAASRDASQLLRALGFADNHITMVDGDDFCSVFLVGSFKGTDLVRRVYDRIVESVEVGASVAESTVRKILPSWVNACGLPGTSLSSISKVVDMPNVTWENEVGLLEPSQAQLRTSERAMQLSSTCDLVTDFVRRMQAVPLSTSSASNDPTVQLHDLDLQVTDDVSVHLPNLLVDARQHVSDRGFIDDSTNPGRFRSVATDPFDDAFDVRSMKLVVGEYVVVFATDSRVPSAHRPFASVFPWHLAAFQQSALYDASFPSNKLRTNQSLREFQANHELLVIKVGRISAVRGSSTPRTTGLMHIRNGQSNDCEYILQGKPLVVQGGKAVVWHEDLKAASVEFICKADFKSTSDHSLSDENTLRLSTGVIQQAREFVSSKVAARLHQSSGIPQGTVHVVDAQSRVSHLFVHVDDKCLYRLEMVHHEAGRDLYKALRFEEFSREDGRVKYVCRNTELVTVQFVEHLFRQVLHVDIQDLLDDDAVDGIYITVIDGYHSDSDADHSESDSDYDDESDTNSGSEWQNGAATFVSSKDIASTNPNSISASSSSSSSDPSSASSLAHSTDFRKSLACWKDVLLTGGTVHGSSNRNLRAKTVPDSASLEYGYLNSCPFWTVAVEAAWIIAHDDDCGALGLVTSSAAGDHVLRMICDGIPKNTATTEFHLIDSVLRTLVDHAPSISEPFTKAVKTVAVEKSADISDDPAEIWFSLFSAGCIFGNDFLMATVAFEQPLRVLPSKLASIISDSSVQGSMRIVDCVFEKQKIAKLMAKPKSPSLDAFVQVDPALVANVIHQVSEVRAGKRFYRLRAVELTDGQHYKSILVGASCLVLYDSSEKVSAEKRFKTIANTQMKSGFGKYSPVRFLFVLVPSA
jgi:hypothetical protein